MALALSGGFSARPTSFIDRSTLQVATVVVEPPAVVAVAAGLVVVVADVDDLLSPHAPATKAMATSDATIQRAFLKVPLLVSPQ